MLVTIPNMVVADGFITTSGGQPIFQAYSLDHAIPKRSTAAAATPSRAIRRSARSTPPIPMTIPIMAVASSTMATSIRT